MKKISIIFSTFFGIGYFPIAPGTFATFFAAILYFFLPLDFKNVNFTEFFIIIFFFGLSIPIVSVAEKILGHDDKKIIIDEFFGYLISILFFEKKIVVLFLAFILFRIFDIFKPEPVNSMQKLPQGWGIMMDDVFAGVYSNVILRLLLLIVGIIGIQI